MTKTQQLATRFRDLFLEGKWIANTNYKETLLNINWNQATTKVKSLNTIALLTQHINYYIEGVLQVFEGGNLTIKDKYSFDFKSISSQQEWEALLNTFFTNTENFANHLEVMSNQKLNENFVKKEYGNYLRNIEAMIEHGYYHLGQINLIKKLIKSKTYA
ncbi:DUF1572 domain-containing protein [Pontimicrobium sp. IMCC45349]|uniref:DUF1572 domain-containing protein n=1 Tax=Pontimicrobium sp. IMCC45349 TaxID=3391574 RepID=UPI00399F1A00